MISDLEYFASHWDFSLYKNSRGWQLLIRDFDHEYCLVCYSGDDITELMQRVRTKVEGNEW